MGKSGASFMHDWPENQEEWPASVEALEEAMRSGWFRFEEMTADDFEAEMAEKRDADKRGASCYFRPEMWVWVDEFSRYIRRTPGLGSDEPSLDETIAEHRNDLAHLKTWAADVWAFVNDPLVGGWQNIEVLNDSGDLPWWDYDGRAWFCIGTRYTVDKAALPRRLDTPPMRSLEWRTR
jgi:hypothetical protein